MTEQAKETQTGETVDYKAELDKLKSDYENVKKANEDLRLEFMSEEYLNFLNAKDSKSEAPAPKKEEQKQAPSPDDDWEKLSKKQIYEKAIKDAEERFNSKFSEREQAQKAEHDARIASEIKEFASSHSDFEAYRQVMVGLSYDPKYANYSLERLYNTAKDHVKSLAGASEEEKKKSKAAQGEKPGHASASVARGGKKLSADEINDETWNEVVGENGLPPAV